MSVLPVHRHATLKLFSHPHRPVIGIFEVEVLEVDEEKREAIYHDIFCQQGPPDGTIIISLPNGEDFDDLLIDNALQGMGGCGEVILVRYGQVNLTRICNKGRKTAGHRGVTLHSVY